MICTQLYGFKYSYLIQIILMEIFLKSYIVSSIPIYTNN